MDFTEQLPDLSRMEEGEEYTVYYGSRRSGNEVDRTGIVTSTFDADDGSPVVHLHDERRDCFKHAYVALTDSELQSGEPVVAAYSLMVVADDPTADERPGAGDLYTLRFSTGRTSYLGLVDRVVRHGSRGPIIIRPIGACDE